MKILDVVESTTQEITLTLSSVESHYVFFGEGLIDIQQEVNYSHASVNLDLASMHSLKESYFLIRFIRAYGVVDKSLGLIDYEVNTIFEKPSGIKKMNDVHPRNFEIQIYLDESRFDKLYALYLSKNRPGLFYLHINLDLYRDSFKYLGKSVDGTENYLINDIRDKQNFGCNFKIARYFFGALVVGK
jgi:hypothetical protein